MTLDRSLTASFRCGAVRGTTLVGWNAAMGVHPARGDGEGFCGHPLVHRTVELRVGPVRGTPRIGPCDSRRRGYPYADARAYLIGFVVVAYCRTILRSNVRGRITDHIDIPAELIGIHEQVKTFRNATIAHPQSELSVTSRLGQQQGRRAGSPPQRGAARLRDLKAPQSGSSLGRTTASTSAPLRITVTSIRCPIASANRRFCND